MSIASELQNYADGLGDAYDAVNDMNGILPAQKNMNNLDAAIRTIPQPTVNDGILTIQKNGTQVATFTANQASNATANITVPTDTSDLTNTAGFITSASLPGDMTGATSGTAGAHGLVPAPSAGDENKVLSGAGTWVAVSSGGSYSAGNGINIDANNEISIDDTVVAELSDLPSDFTGATSLTAGAHGLVPAPAAGDDSKFLSGDGTWKAVQSGATVTTFYRGSTWASIYKDSGLTTAATGQDILDALADGPVDISVTENSTNFTYSIVEYVTYTNDVEADFTLVASAAPRMITLVTPDVSQTSFMASTTRFQGELTAGSNITISGNNTISATDTTYTNFTGATSSVAGAAGLVPAPAAGDEGKALHGDGTWKDTTAKLVEMSYGESNAWVYCRASSNANPATGSQTRKAFMAYVNNAASPTNVEFQYVRSMSSKTDSQQCDQVFVYTLTNASGGTWSVASRNVAPKINVSGPITKTFTTGANASVSIGANAMTGATSSTAGAAGVVPAPAAGDQAKVLSGAGTWVNQPTVPTVISDLTDDVGLVYADDPTSTVSPDAWVASSDIDWTTLGAPANGYLKLGTVKIQWGVNTVTMNGTTAGSYGSKTVTLNTSMSGTDYAAVVTPQDPGVTNALKITAQGKQTGQFTVTAGTAATSGSATITFSWIVIGV